MIHWFRLSTICAVVWCAYLLNQAMAALPPIEHIDPGRIAQEYTEKQLTPQRTTPTIPKVAHKHLAKKDAQQRFTLKSIKLEGVSVFSTEELQWLYHELLDTVITVQQLFEIADSITHYYRSCGFMLTKALVPPQRIEQGHVTIKVVEGFIDSVLVQDEGNEGNSLVNAHIVHDVMEPVTFVRPLHIHNLERAILLANDMPGIKAKSILKPSKQTFGGADLVIVASEDKYEGLVAVDNRVSKRYGPVMFTAAGYVNNLLTASRTGALAKVSVHPSRMQMYNLSHMQYLTTGGLKVLVLGQYVINSPYVNADGFNNFDIQGNSSTFSAAFSYPIMRTRAFTWMVQSSLDMKHTYSTTKMTGTVQKKIQDRIRSIRFGTQAEIIDNWLGTTLLSLELSQGLPIFNASKKGAADVSRMGASATYTKMTADASRVQYFENNFSVLVAMEAQFAFAELLSPEEFGLGGSQIGRGYDDSEIVGDHGLGAKAELRFHHHPPIKYVDTVQYYAFVEGGIVWNINKSQEAKQAITSTGIGLRVNVKKHYAMSLELAKPLTRQVASEQNKNLRVFFSVNAWV